MENESLMATNYRANIKLWQEETHQNLEIFINFYKSDYLYND